MKWRGRRQSTNVDDLTNVKSININWNFGDRISGLTIDSDGAVYGIVEGTALNIKLIPAQTKPSHIANEDFYPLLTSGQVNSIRTIMGLFLTIDKGSLRIGSPVHDADFQLVELIYSILGR